MKVIMEVFFCQHKKNIKKRLCIKFLRVLQLSYENLPVLAPALVCLNALFSYFDDSQL